MLDNEFSSVVSLILSHQELTDVSLKCHFLDVVNYFRGILLLEQSGPFVDFLKLVYQILIQIEQILNGIVPCYVWWYIR